MSKDIDLYIFIFAMLVFTLFWGRIVLFFDKKPKLVNPLVYFFMKFSSMPFYAIRSVIFTAIYLSVGISGIIVFSYIYDLSCSDLLGMKLEFLLVAFLGILAEVSVTIFFTNIWFATVGTHVDPFAEVNNIPWIRGLSQLPKAIFAFMPACTGFIEEVAFRGVFLLILIKNFFITPWIAIAMITILFLIDQLVQVITINQAVILAASCISISITGGLLVVYTGSALPACIAHASFVLFFFRFLGSNE